MSYTDFDFPHTSLYTTDLRELIANLRKLEEIVKNFVNLEQLKFADPILWNISTQYQKGTIVLDSQGNAYVSKEIVPAGVRLDNEDYWLKIFNFIDYIKSFNSNLTINIESNTDRATSSYTVDDWLVWNDILYNVTSNIAIDELFIIYPNTGANIKRFTVEEFIKAFMTWARNTIQQYKNDIDASELAYVAAMQAEVDRILAGATVDSEVIDARLGANGINYSTLGNAIRTQIGYLNNDVNEAQLLNVAWTSGGFIRKNTGAIYAAEVWSYSNFIKVSKDTALSVITTIGTNAVIGLYTRNKKYYSDIHNDDERQLKQYTFIVPDDVEYIRLSCLTEDVQYVTVAVQSGLFDSDIQTKVSNIDKNVIATLGNDVDYGNLETGVFANGVPDLTDTTHLISSDFIPFSDKYIIINHDYMTANHIIGKVVLYDSSYNYIPLYISVNDLNSDKPFTLERFKPFSPAYFKFELRYYNNQTIVADTDIDFFKEKIKIYDLTDTMFNQCTTKLEEKFDYYDGSQIFPLIEHGAISGSGEPEANDRRIRTADFISYNPDDIILNTFEHSTLTLDITVKIYDENFSLIRSFNYTPLNNFFSLRRYYSFRPSYIKFALKLSDNSIFSDLYYTIVAREISIIHAGLGMCRFMITDNEHDITIDDLSDVMTNNQITASFTKYIYRKDNNYDNLIFTCNAKYENAEGYSGKPTIQFGYAYSGGYATLGTITYILGNENEYQLKQWRVVRPPHQNDMLIIRVTIPAGCTVTMKTFEGKRDNRIDRSADYVRFDGHQRLYSMPYDIKISAEMTAIAGYTSMIQIPKRLSDGVWIFYHDDTLTYNNTYIRQSDGSLLSDSYNNTPWSSISSAEAFSWDWGIGQNAYYAGAKPMTMEEFFLLCAKTGMKPMLSIHPTLSATEYQEIKEIAQKTGVLNKLGIVGIQSRILTAWSVFGNDIDTYIINLSATSHSASDINDAITAMQSMTDCTCRQVIELFAGSAYEAYFGSTPYTPFEMILNAGYIAGIVQQNGATKPISGVTTLYENGSDLEYWITQHGVTEFCHEAQYSAGLNW